ncbi:MAG: Rho-binding antiterminator [Methylobacter sp.]
MNKSSISCDLHDYLEVACMYGYQVQLTLNDHRIIEGKAIDTMTTADKREFLVIDMDHGHGQKEQIELNQIRKLQVQTPNAKFSEVIF